jgi:hypothetical protein
MRSARLATLASLALFALVPPLVVACGSEGNATDTGESTPSPDAGTKKPGTGNPAPSDTTDPGTNNPDSGPSNPPGSCPRTAKPDDHVRKVVVSHPYNENPPGPAQKAKDYEVLELSTTGTLTKTNVKFQMGRSLNDIVFTPDGEVGITAQEDGTLGVFKFDKNTGAVQVVHTNFTAQVGGKTAFYAARVVMSHDGSRVFIIDRNTRENGGGIYDAKINCDGTLTFGSQLVSGGKAHAMALIPSNPQTAVLIAGSALSSPTTDYSHRIDLSTNPPARTGGGSVFTTEAIASWVSVTPDSKWAFVTDDSLYGSKMAPINLTTMAAGATLTTSNPAGMVMSPFGNAGLLIESTGTDHLKKITYDAANATTPFAVGAEVAYVGGATELPSWANVITRGTLKGRILVSELEAVRQLDFGADGSITDRGTFSVASGVYSGLIGGFGIEP